MLFITTIQNTINTAVQAIKTVTDGLNALIGTPATSLAADIAAISSPVPVRKTVTFSTTAASTIPIFTVTGFVKVKIYARCKTDLAAAGGANLRLGIVGSTDCYIADTDVLELDEGDIWKDITPTEKRNIYYDAVFEDVLGNGDDIQIINDAQVDSGVMEFACEFTALSSDGDVVAT